MVHAEPPVDWKFLELYGADQKTFWGRTKFKTEDETWVKNIDRVVVGHTPLKQVKRLGNVVNIDTGAFAKLITTDRATES